MKFVCGLVARFAITLATAATAAAGAAQSTVDAAADEPISAAENSVALTPADLLPGIEYGFRKSRIDGTCTIYKGVVIERSEETVTIIAHSRMLSTRWFYVVSLLNIGIDRSGGWKSLDDEHINISVEDISYIWLAERRSRNETTNEPKAASP